MSISNENVNKFMSRFHSSSDINTVFTSGCCYWFAFILFCRFIEDGASIMYDEVMNHFGTKIQDRIYDITGDVTDDYKWVPWSGIQDDSLRDRITRDCIQF